jgi:hypothetical protein
MVIKRSIGVAVAVGPCWILLSVLASAQPRLAERLVEPVGLQNGSLFVHPGISQSHFRFVVAMLARSVRIPIGLEEVAQEPQEYDGDLAKVATEDKTTLIGMTVGRALDALIAVDPRYAWREEDGVLIMRPVEAWRDRTHFLNEIVGPINERQRRAIDIVKGLYDRKGLRINWSSGGGIYSPTLKESDLDLPISVTLPTSTMLGVLNAIATSHGQLGWLVEYARGSAEFRYSCIRLITFDGRFGGVGPIACPAGYCLRVRPMRQFLRISRSNLSHKPVPVPTLF